MAGDRCSCGSRFLDAEDFRDHMPCPGSPLEQAYARGLAEGRRVERERIVAWMREELCCNCETTDHPTDTAAAIERGEHLTLGEG